MMNEKLLRDKVVLVTGGSGGIGSAICVEMSAQGATVIIHYNSNEAKAQELCETLNAQQGKAFVVQADLSNSDDIKKMFKTIKEEHKAIDILINNAGQSFNALVSMTTDKQWDHVMNTNLKSAFVCSKFFVKDRLRKKAPGTIINIASVAGLQGSVGLGAYSIAKAGLISLTKTMAREYAQNNIRVNAIAPGPIDTEMANSISEADKTKAAEEVPLKRMGLPEEIAATTVFLASQLSSFTTGAIIPIDGGLTA